MYLTKEKIQDIFKDNGSSEKDTGSTEGQIALFTTRINHLTDHLSLTKDYNTKITFKNGWKKKVFYLI